jgi:hypothetical protein
MTPLTSAVELHTAHAYRVAITGDAHAGGLDINAHPIGHCHITMFPLAPLTMNNLSGAGRERKLNPVTPRSLGLHPALKGWRHAGIRGSCVEDKSDVHFPPRIHASKWHPPCSSARSFTLSCSMICLALRPRCHRSLLPPYP